MKIIPPLQRGARGDFQVKWLFGLLSRIFRLGRGRPLAAAALAVFSLILIYPEQSPLKSFRNTLFDTYQTYLPRERASAPVTIVGIDEASLKTFGQWPWPRSRLAALIDSIAAYQPAVIGLDIIMPEPDGASPARIAESIPQIDQTLRRQIASLPSNDHVLAAALARTPTVLAAAGFDYPSSTTSSTMRSAPFISRGGDAAAYIKHYPAVLKSLPELEQAASGQGLVSADLEKGVIRRLPMIATVGQTLIPSLSLESLRVAGGLQALEVDVGSGGIAFVGLSDVRIPTETNGEVWVHFTPFLPERYVSALDVLTGRTDPDMLRQKIVLLGLTGLGLLDYHTTPLGVRVPGIEVHAQILENIFDQRFLTRPAWLIWMEFGLFMACGILLLTLLPALKPRWSMLLIIVLIGAVICSGFLLYHFVRILLDASTLSMGFACISICLLSSTFIEADRERRNLQQKLQLEREAAAHLAGELEAARRIQMGSLPQPDSVLKGESRVELDAFLEPARQVGGDLYDFYFIDKDHLLVIIGDVSGKGLPASLFMVITKILTKSIALGGGSRVNEIINRANRELARENPEMLFVTAVAAVLHLETGLMEYVIAGHDAPWRINSEGVVDRLPGEGTLALSVFEELEYNCESVQLHSGDVICIVTDGITEAMNVAGNLYSTQRLTELLRKIGSPPDVFSLVRSIREDVSAFVGDAEQSDDLTLLALRWHGPKVGLNVY